MATTQIEPAIRIGEWLTIAAALIGPILAVQAQKMVEAARAKYRMKDWIFQTLMATRSARLSPEHVRALNAIDIAFYGKRILKFHWQSVGEKSVRRAWKVYFDTLSIDNSKFSEDENRRLIDHRTDKFIELLSALAVAQNYDFDPVDLRKNIYNPVAHTEIEEHQRIAREQVVKLLRGETAINMRVVELPGTADR